MSSLPNAYLTPEEYLELERRAEHKSEYFAGEMFAMAGGSRRHTVITGDTLIAFELQLRGTACEAYSSEMRVRIDETGLYTYPDIVVACGDRRFLDLREDTLLNPKVIVEVLSASTEMYDRGKKWEHYQQLPSLCAYLLVSQDRPRVEVFSRPTGTAGWSYSSHWGLEAEAVVPPMGCELALADIYRRVRFEAETDTTQEGERLEAKRSESTILDDGDLT